MGHDAGHHDADRSTAGARTVRRVRVAVPAPGDLSLVDTFDTHQDPDVTSLALSRRNENLAVCAQLRAVAGMYRSWQPDEHRLREDGLRRRRHTSAESTHDSRVVAQTASTLGLTESAASRRIDAAVALYVTRRLPRTAHLAGRGRLDWRRIDAVVARTRDLTPEQAASVEDRVLVPAVRTLTIGRFEDAVDRAVLAADPDAAQERRAEVTRARRVSLWKNRTGSDGLDAGVTLRAEGPADALTAAMACLDAAARWCRDHGDPRTLDQLRHDLLVTGCTTGRLDVPQQVLDGSPGRSTSPGASSFSTDLPTAGSTTDGERCSGSPTAVVGPRPAVPVHLTVTVSMQTLLGLNEEPGTLAGYGPIPAQMVRDLAADAIWRCAAVDDTHGTVLGVGRRTYTPGYVPGKNLRQFLAVSSPTCEIPWCNARADRCDLDHRRPHARGGATCVCNVGPTCRRHHRLKSAGDLTAEPSTDPAHPLGTMVWTMPGGEQVVVLPYAPLPPEAYRSTGAVDGSDFDASSEAGSRTVDGDRAVPPADDDPPF